MIGVGPVQCEEPKALHYAVLYTNSRIYDVSTSPAGLCISLKPYCIPRGPQPKMHCLYQWPYRPVLRTRGSQGWTLSEQATSDSLFQFSFYTEILLILCA